jgi:hypothetical protein
MNATLRKPSDFQWFTTLYPSGEVQVVAICSNCVESFRVAAENQDWRKHECLRTIVSAPIRKAE